MRGWFEEPATTTNHLCVIPFTISINNASARDMVHMLVINPALMGDLAAINPGPSSSKDHTDISPFNREGHLVARASFEAHL